jgi:hypothetical protein
MPKQLDVEELAQLFPHHINSYYRCPRSFFWTYVHKHRMSPVFNSPQVIGGLTHKVIAKVLTARKDGLPEPQIDELVREYVATERYEPEDGDELRAQHIPIIIEHVQRGLNALPQDAEILHIEEKFQHSYQSRRIGSDVTLAAKVDLVLQASHGVVDHVDFKTGKGGGDPIQNYMSRLTVGKSLGLATDTLRTVNVLTEIGEYKVCAMRDDSVRGVWEIIQDQIAALRVDTVWIPRPQMPFCSWCKFLPICTKGKELVAAEC